MKIPELSIVILSKNEEDVIGDAIASVKEYCDDIIVIDANSSDSTSKIVEKQGVRLIKHHFIDFSDQRNFGIYQVKRPWVLFLDADERVTSAFMKEVGSVIQNYQEFDKFAGYFVRRKTFYYGKDWGLTDRVQRLFVVKRFVEWSGVVHETPTVKGEFGELISPILHFTHRNMSQMVQKTNEWSEYEAKLRYNSNHPPLVPWRFIRVMISEFINSYIKNKGYRNGYYGVIEGMYQSFSIFITYAKLWELQQKKK